MLKDDIVVEIITVVSSWITALMKNHAGSNSLMHHTILKWMLERSQKIESNNEQKYEIQVS